MSTTITATPTQTLTQRQLDDAALEAILARRGMGAVLGTLSDLAGERADLQRAYHDDRDPIARDFDAVCTMVRVAADLVASAPLSPKW